MKPQTRISEEFGKRVLLLCFFPVLQNEFARQFKAATRTAAASHSRWRLVARSGKANEKESFCAFSLSILYCCFASAKLAEAQLRAVRDFYSGSKGVRTA